MKKIAIASIITLFCACTCAFVAGVVSAQKGWEKTLTLPSGEKVLDMRGEWDVLYEFYGQFSTALPKSDILTITQQGNTFTAVQRGADKWIPKGTERIKGELDKDGFKEVQILRADGKGGMIWVPCKGEISENGNKVVVDEDLIKATLTRR